MSVSTSPEQSTQVSDPIDLDPSPPLLTSHKRSTETSQEELDDLALEGIKVFRSSKTDALFDDKDVIEVEVEAGASHGSVIPLSSHVQATLPV